MPESNFKWTNSSVLLFAEGADPIEAIEKKARDVALDAIDKGWEGPPFDPIRLADMLKLAVSARDEVADARTVPHGRSGLVIEFNPSRARGRVRFSIAHEIAHTFFPDCGQRVRNREHHKSLDDNWQLEMLCNIAAAELIMPMSGISELIQNRIGIDQLVALQRQFDVSMEALLIRATKLSDDKFLAFTASRGNNDGDRYKIDYTIPSRSWRGGVSTGYEVPEGSVVADCNAIGYTAKSVENWPGVSSRARIECIGLPPYPGSSYPRVVGVIRNDRKGVSAAEGKIEFLQGSALEPIGTGPKIVAHVINDKTANWGGGGFAARVRRTWPDDHRMFREWTLEDSDNLTLGHTFPTEIDNDLYLFNMIAQHGFGASETPRIRYAALERCLITLRDYADSRNASIHMPRIGTGHAGGKWELVQEMIVEHLVRAGVSVYVYDLPPRYSTHAPHDFQLSHSPRDYKASSH